MPNLPASEKVVENGLVFCGERELTSIEIERPARAVRL
jgi:hypothetical protein